MKSTTKEIANTRLPKWANLKNSSRYLSINEVNKRRKLLLQIGEYLQQNLPKEAFREANAELKELFLG